MSPIPLSDEDTRVIFSDEALDRLDRLEGSQQKQLLRRLLSIVEAETPPSAHVYEKIQNLDIFAAGSIRVYSRVVENIPRGNTMYHIISIFFIDEGHDYPHTKLATYNAVAQERVDRLTSLESVDDVEAYLERMDALDEDDLRDLLS